MKIHYLQHVPFEGLGFIANWLKEKDHTISCTQVWKDNHFPSADDFDGLVIMGGPMSINDDALFPWLIKEKKLIKEAIEANKKVIGICLGAQLIAHVLGARVYPNTYKEIGWWPVAIHPSFGEWLHKYTGPKTTVFHWHGDTFDLPPGCVHHASSAGCPYQLFTYGDNVIGLQFHPEAAPELIEAMVAHEGHELSANKYVQTAETILQETAYYKKSNEWMAAILERLFVK